MSKSTFTGNHTLVYSNGEEQKIQALDIIRGADMAFLFKPLKNNDQDYFRVLQYHKKDGVWSIINPHDHTLLEPVDVKWEDTESKELYEKRLYNGMKYERLVSRIDGMTKKVAAEFVVHMAKLLTNKYTVHNLIRWYKEKYKDEYPIEVSKCSHPKNAIEEQTMVDQDDCLLCGKVVWYVNDNDC